MIMRDLIIVRISSVFALKVAGGPIGKSWRKPMNESNTVNEDHYTVQYISRSQWQVQRDAERCKAVCQELQLTPSNLLYTSSHLYPLSSNVPTPSPLQLYSLSPPSTVIVSPNPLYDPLFQSEWTEWARREREGAWALEVIERVLPSVEAFISAGQHNHWTLHLIWATCLS